MRNKVILVILFLGFFSINTKYAAAEEALDWFKEIQINGFVSTAYSYNFNEPSDSMNRIRIFDNDDNSFKLDVAELVFQKEAADPGSVGFRIDLMYGYSVPEVIQSSSTGTKSDDFEIQQAYVTYNAPIGNGLTIDFGKFITHMGLEIIEGYDGWNYNYSRSILFGYAIPFTHTGVKASYDFNDMFSAMVMLANGWDSDEDNNDSKTVGFQLVINPFKWVSLYLNYVGGPENQVLRDGQVQNDQDWTHVADVILLINPIDKLEIQLNYDYGKVDLKSSDGSEPEWWGFAGVVRYSLTDYFAMNFRGEFFDDKLAARTGMQQELWEITVTPELTINDHLILRAEYRHDESNEDFFMDKNKGDDSQDTVAINAMFYF